jgi:prefoldin subunit 5
MEETMNRIDDLIEYLEDNKSSIDVDIEETENLLNELHNYKETLDGLI